MQRKTFAKIGGWVFLVWILACVIALFTSFAHGSIKTNHAANSLGVEQLYQNPMGYMVGNVIDYAVMEDDERLYTNVSFKPLGSTMIYSESILFCGNAAKYIDGTGLYIFTFRKQASRMFQGVACHEIYKVILLRQDIQ